MKTISLCMITKNEEKYLESCLKSVQGIVDEIIIADTGSTDNTKEVAAKFGAKVWGIKWSDDFSAARNESLKQATKDWILVLDADEMLDEKGRIEIKKLVESPLGFYGFSLEQRSYLANPSKGAIKNDSDFEEVKKYQFYISNFLVRLFKNNSGIAFRNRVHELVEDSLKEKDLKSKKSGVIIHHLGSLNPKEQQEQKYQAYQKIILKQLEDDSNSPRYNYQAARMYLGIKNYTKALEYFGKTAKLDPKYKLVYSEIAKIHLLMDDKNRAIEFFKKSQKENPEDPSTANNLAVVYMSMGKFGRAKELLEDAIKKTPDNKPLKYNYSQCLKNLGK
ncbi:MAG TPA: glycosyltransferase [Candidatus Nanoarchaeia archaeon]|nr:glycosyltransferase [Candidatus Nanoarchaeia archaeon]